MYDEFGLGTLLRAAVLDPLAEKALTKAQRAKLKASDFVFPKSKTWPIHDVKHGQIALVWSTWPQHRKVAKTVRKAVFKRYPELIAKFPKLAASVGIKPKKLKKAA